MRSDANSQGPVDVSGSPHARLQPLAAEIDGGLWAERRRLNRELLLVEGARKLEEAGNFHNLRVAAGQEDGEFIGMRFADSDVHKWLEALGWELGARAVRRAGGARRHRHRARRRRPGAERLPQLVLPGRPDRDRALRQPRLGSRALLRRPPDPGGGRPRARHRRHAAAGRRPPPRRPHRRGVRPRAQRGHARASRDRDRARRAPPPHRRAALPRARGLPRRHPRPRDAPARQVRLGLLPGPRAGARGDRGHRPLRARSSTSTPG